MKWNEEKKKKNEIASTRIIDNNLFVCVRVHGYHRAPTSNTPKHHSILYSRISDERVDNEQRMVEEEWGSGASEGTRKAEKKNCRSFCALFYLLYEMNFVETISLSGQHLAVAASFTHSTHHPRHGENRKIVSRMLIIIRCVFMHAEL